MIQDTISRSCILPWPQCYDKRQPTEQLQIILPQQVSTTKVQRTGVEMVVAACQRHISNPPLKYHCPFLQHFVLIWVEGSRFLHFYLSPVVIFSFYASKAAPSSKETPLSYMLNIFDPGLASSNSCLCFKNQISADKEAFTENQPYSESPLPGKPLPRKHPNCSNHLSWFLFVQTKLAVINSLLQSTTSPSVLLSLYSWMRLWDINFPRYVHWRITSLSLCASVILGTALFEEKPCESFPRRTGPRSVWFSFLSNLNKNWQLEAINVAQKLAKPHQG